MRLDHKKEQRSRSLITKPKQTTIQKALPQKRAKDQRPGNKKPHNSRRPTTKESTIPEDQSRNRAKVKKPHNKTERDHKSEAEFLQLELYKIISVLLLLVLHRDFEVPPSPCHFLVLQSGSKFVQLRRQSCSKVVQSCSLVQIFQSGTNHAVWYQRCSLELFIQFSFKGSVQFSSQRSNPQFSTLCSLVCTDFSSQPWAPALGRILKGTLPFLQDVIRKYGPY